MNRMLAGLALASAAALMAATPAQAAITQAPAKPVTAVKKQLVPGKGVTFTERTTLDSGRMRAVFVRSSGTYQFSRSGLAASDITGKLNIKASDLADLGEGSMFQSLAKPERTIRIGTTSYLSGSIWAELLPSGKTWYKAPGGPLGRLHRHLRPAAEHRRAGHAQDPVQERQAGQRRLHGQDLRP